MPAYLGAANESYNRIKKVWPNDAIGKLDYYLPSVSSTKEAKHETHNPKVTPRDMGDHYVASPSRQNKPVGATAAATSSHDTYTKNNKNQTNLFYSASPSASSSTSTVSSLSPSATSNLRRHYQARLNELGNEDGPLDDRQFRCVSPTAALSRSSLSSISEHGLVNQVKDHHQLLLASSSFGIRDDCKSRQALSLFRHRNNRDDQAAPGPSNISPPQDSSGFSELTGTTQRLESLKAAGLYNEETLLHAQIAPKNYNPQNSEGAKNVDFEHHKQGRSASSATSIGSALKLLVGKTGKRLSAAKKQLQLQQLQFQEQQQQQQLAQPLNIGAGNRRRKITRMNRRMLLRNGHDGQLGGQAAAYSYNAYALSELFSQSEIPGFREIFASDSYLRKVCWIVAFLIMTVLSLKDMTELITEYYDYPITVDVRLRDSARLPFPAVTVCNLNVVRFTSLCSSARLEITRQIPSELRDRLCGIQVEKTKNNASTSDSDIGDINNIGITTTTTTTTTTTSSTTTGTSISSTTASSITSAGGGSSTSATPSASGGNGSLWDSNSMTTVTPTTSVSDTLITPPGDTSGGLNLSQPVGGAGALATADEANSMLQPQLSDQGGHNAGAWLPWDLGRKRAAHRQQRGRVPRSVGSSQEGEVVVDENGEPQRPFGPKRWKLKLGAARAGQLGAGGRRPASSPMAASSGTGLGAKSQIQPGRNLGGAQQVVNSNNKQPGALPGIQPLLPPPASGSAAPGGPGQKKDQNAAGFNFVPAGGSNDLGDFELTERQERELQENLTNWLAVMYQRDAPLTRSLGHQFDDMILRCTMKSINCTRQRSFESSFSPTEGNCFTYRSKIRRRRPASSVSNSKGQVPGSASGSSGSTNGKQDVQWDSFEDTNLAGTNDGLELVLNLEKNEYISGSSQVGALVMIHHPSDLGYAASEATFITPEFTTYIGLKMVNITRLPAPYPEYCVDSWPAKFADNLIRNSTYSQQACLKICLQKTIQSYCSCQSAFLPIVELDSNQQLQQQQQQQQKLNTSSSGADSALIPSAAAAANSTGKQEATNQQQQQRIIICDTRKLATRQCVRDINLRAADRVHNCECPPKCQVVRYDKTISMARWPTREDKVSFDRGKLDVNFQNLAKVIVYFQTMTCEEVTQQAVFNAAKLFSALGGIMGMYVGFSFLSVFEIFEVMSRKFWHYLRLRF